jgi:hypothetical protein
VTYGVKEIIVATQAEAFEKLKRESTLFTDSGQVDDAQLTPEQRIALQRRGRTERVQDTTRPGGITIGGYKAIEEAALSDIGGQLASGNSLIVPNVQRDKQSRIDERSRGGTRSLSDSRALQALKLPAMDIPTPGGMQLATMVAPAGPSTASQIARWAKRGVDRLAKAERTERIESGEVGEGDLGS